MRRNIVLPPHRCQSRVHPLIWFLTVNLLFLVIWLPGLGQAYESDLDLPVTPTVSGAGPDLFTGTMGASIPLDLPKGTHGVEPKLALVYRGGNGNGTAGVGWKLDVGSIERQSRFGVDYSKDLYVLRLNGASTDLVQDSPGSNQFWAKIEGTFFRILKKIAADGKPYWEITDRKGTLYRFGYTSASRQEDPADASRIFRWGLDWVLDTLSNNMELTYFKDQGQLYFEHAAYTGYKYGTAQWQGPLYQLYVGRDPIATPSTVYTAGFAVTTRYKYAVVAVWYVSGATWKMIRTYHFAYTTSPQSGLPLLQSVKQYGRDAVITTPNGIQTVTGTSLPPTTLTYSTDPAPNQFVDQGSQPSNPCATGSPMGSADFNGDGRGDFWCHEHSSGAPTYVALSGGTGQLGAWSQAVNGWCGNGFYFTTGDADGDGVADLICHGGSQTYVLLNVVNDGVPSFTNPPDGGIWRQNWCPGGNNGNPSGHFGVGDFDGDGRTDIRCLDGSVRVAVSNGGAFVTAPNAPNGEVWRTSWCTTGDVFGTADFNGDGKADISCRTGGDYRVSLSDGTKFVVGPNSDLWRSGWCAGAQFNGVADFNGDGKADWYCRVENGSGPMWVQLSTGSSFVSGANGNQWHSSWCWSGAQAGTGDFNGDGKMDLYCHGDGGTWIGLSDGKAFNFTTPDGTWKMNWCPNGATFAIRDINGDGKADLWCRDQSTMSVALSGSSPGPADALLTIANGLGGQTTVAYGYYTPQISQGAPFTLSVVGSLTTTDGNGLSATTTFTYTGAYYHVAQREFRGFNQVTILGPPGPANLPSERRKTTIWLHQGDDLGLINTPNTLNGYLRGKPYRIQIADGSGQLYQERTTTYAPGKGGHAWVFNPPLTITDTTCDGTACTKSRTTTYAYDDGYAEEYGNVTKEIYTGTGTTSRTLVRQFAPNTTVWIVSLPFQETIYEGEGTSGPIKANTAYLYEPYGAAPNMCMSTGTGSQMPTWGMLRSIVRGVGPETGGTYFGYNSRGDGPTCQTTATGGRWEYTYALGGSQLSTISDPINTSTQYSYSNGTGTSNFGQLVKIAGENLETTTFEYDAVGRPIKRTVRYDEPGSTYITTMSYPSWGTVGQQRIETTDAAGLVTKQYFDGFQRTIKQTSTGPDSSVLAQKTEYDARGNVHRKSIPYVHLTGQETPAGTTFSYDLLGRPTTTVNPDGTSIQVCEDDWVRVTIDPRGLRRRQTRDAFGRVTLSEEFGTINSSCDTASGTPYASMSFQYDVLGNQLLATDIRGNKVHQVYDSLSRRTHLYDPDLGHWTYAYDAAGNLISQTDARNKTVYFKYDGANNIVQQDYDVNRPLGSSNADVVYKYGEDKIDGYNKARGRGRLTTRKEVNGNQVQFIYDRIGRVLRRIQTINGDVKRNWFTYDGLDRPTSVQYYDNATVSYEYNGPWLKRVYEGATTYAQFANFTAPGQPGTLTLGNGVVTTYIYGVEGGGTGGCQAASFRLCTLVTSSGGATLQNLGYSYDANGNVTGIADPIGGNQSYTYDNNDRLQHASGPVFNYDNQVDELGNLKAWPVVGQYAYPASGSGYGHRPHAVCATGPTLPASCSGGTTQYTYDANGNMTGGAGRTIVYDTPNRPTTFTTAGGTTTIVYDGDGGRVKKTVPGGSTVTYFGQWVECENTQCVKYIWAGAKRLAVKQVSNGLMTYYHTDHQNSTRLITNDAGLQQESISYYPYGQQWQDTGTANVPYKYTAQEYDATTGLYFYKARYYDALLGRFIQPDTIVANALSPQSWNRYSYVMNNPLKYEDPTGHFDEIPNSQDWSFANGSFTPDAGNLTGYILGRELPSTDWSVHSTTSSVATYYNVINGMGNTLDQAINKAIGQVAGHDANAPNLTLWHNPSEGFFLDLLESAADKVGFTTQIAKQTASLLSSNPDSLWFLHSQGSLIFSSAVSYLNGQGVSLSNVSAVFNGAAANRWVTGGIMAQAGVTIKEWNGHPGDFVHDVIGLNTLNPLRFVPAILMVPTMWIPGASEHCCYP